MDLDFTLIIQIFVILVALVIGARIMARPFIQAMLAREARIEGAKGEAAKLDQETKDMAAKRNSILDEKHRELTAERSAKLIQTRGHLQSLRHELQDKHIQSIAQSRQELQDYEAATRDHLAAVTAELSDSVVASLLSREVK